MSISKKAIDYKRKGEQNRDISKVMLPLSIATEKGVFAVESMRSAKCSLEPM